MSDTDNTGWTGAPPGMLQDDSAGMSKWLASKPDAMRNAREAAAAIMSDTDKAAPPAAPLGEVVVTKDMHGRIVAVTRQDEEGRILSVIAESADAAPPARAPECVIVCQQSVDCGAWPNGACEHGCAQAERAAQAEPYGHVTTHSTGQQFFYRYPEPPYLDNAKECVAVYTAPPAAQAGDELPPLVAALRTASEECVRKDVAGWGAISDAADALESLSARVASLQARLEAATADNTKLRTVMVAAAEEIHAHWDAHCDAEGYGPANLMRRLEEGIPAEYGYTAGAFAALAARGAQAEPAWIPCAERLPITTRGSAIDFLVACKRGHDGRYYVFEATYLHEKWLAAPLDDIEADGRHHTGWYLLVEPENDDSHYDPVCSAEGDEVTHWMTKPIAPRSKG